MRRARRPADRAGFTLTELLVVITIIILITAATLPVVMPALSERQVSDAARLLQASLASTRDAAVRSGRPAGIRLLPDPQFPGPNPLAMNRIVQLETPDDHTQGSVSIPDQDAQPIPNIITVFEARELGNTNWYYNIRQGDRIRFGNSGNTYTIAGPMRTFTNNGLRPGVNPVTKVVNPERFLNEDIPGGAKFVSLPPGATPPGGFRTDIDREWIFLVNGQDDDGDGWVDEAFDGIDNDGDGIIDPGFNGIDDDNDGLVDEPDEMDFSLTGGDEHEEEKFRGSDAGLGVTSYTIVRRPVIAERAQVITLPSDIVIDLTGWNAATFGSTSQVFAPERSRLPVDPFSYTVDIMIAPSGEVIPATAGQSSAEVYAMQPFFHFWLADREDVYPAERQPAGNAQVYAPYLLPMTSDAANYPSPLDTRGLTLKRNRRLVTLSTRTGQIVTTTVEIFDANNVNRPFLDAQAGVREKP